MLERASPAGGPDCGAAGARLSDLFESHARMVQGLCRLLLRDPDDAEDAAQQTFLSAHRALLAGNVPRNGGAWLAAIARNECRARVRARMREPLPLNDGLASLPGTSFDAAALAEEMSELKAALLQLPPKQREAVLLRDLFGLGYAEVATALGTSRPAVEALLVRGRRRIQDRLRPLRDVAATLVASDGLRAALEDAVPGFGASATPAGAVAVGAGLAKFGAPAATKLAAAALAVGAAGTAGTVAIQEETPRRDQAVAAAPRAELESKSRPIAIAEEPPPPPVPEAAPPAAKKPRALVAADDDADDDEDDRRGGADDADTDDDDDRTERAGPAARAAGDDDTDDDDADEPEPDTDDDERGERDDD